MTVKLPAAKLLHERRIASGAETEEAYTQVVEDQQIGPTSRLLTQWFAGERLTMKPRGHIKAGKGNLVGNAGEYYVMAELLKRGWVAALAPRNAPGFDIFVTDGGQTAKIRVKTKSQGYSDWQWVTRKDGTLFRDLAEKADFTVLVNLAEKTAELQYFVVPTHRLYALICTEHNNWLATPGRNGRPHSPTNRKRHVNEVRDRGFLAPFEDGWDGLWQ